MWLGAGPAPAAGGAAGLLLDLAVGQRFLQFGNARVGDLGEGEVKSLLQVGQPRKVLQPRVGDLGFVKVELPQIGQPLKVHQPRVGNLTVAEFEILQLGIHGSTQLTAPLPMVFDSYFSL